jgi:hypothetical protein
MKPTSQVLGVGAVYVRTELIAAMAEHGANTLVTLKGGAPEYVVEESLPDLCMQWSNELVST